MVVKMYSVYDFKSSIYNPPICCHNRGDAIRFFDRLFQDPKRLENQYPSDFKIFEVGSYDNLTGIITVDKNPLFICNVEDIIGNSKEKVDK